MQKRKINKNEKSYLFSHSRSQFEYHLLRESFPDPSIPTRLTQPFTFVIFIALTTVYLILGTVCPSLEGRSMAVVFPVSSTVSGNKRNIKKYLCTGFIEEFGGT